MADETYKGEFYCVKCKEKREAEGKVVVSENGRRMAKGVCPVCGTNLNTGSCECSPEWEDPRLAPLKALARKSDTDA